VAPGALAHVLRPLQERFKRENYPDLLVGLGEPDDAAVYRIAPDRAIIQTADFFPPVVDDPYAFGAIAAANAMSDVYAMGGEVLFALNLAAFPEDLPEDMVAEILRGSADKVAEAGGAIAGGHTVRDREPKYGLAVTGIVHPDRLLTKGGARVGDVLVLTKPLGTGVITTALKREQAAPDHVQSAIESMSRLNRAASHAALQAGARAATDITGYGLIGHALEMAEQAGVCFRLRWADIPLLPGAQAYADAWTFPGGAENNEAYYRPRTRFDVKLTLAQEWLLFDPETSGGLLVAVPPEQVNGLLTALGQGAWRIGEVTRGSGIVVE
jgi:selenide, water dikinase